MESKAPSIIDLNAEAAKLTMFYGRTPQTTFRERRGSAAQLALYRDGFLLLSKFDGKSHWETHPADELFYVLDGAMTVDIVYDDGPPKSIALDAGVMAIVPQSAWHRVHSADGVTVISATLPSDHIDLDVDDPRTVAPEIETEGRAPDVVDLNAEVAKLISFRRTPHSTAEDRKGSVARLAPYRDGLLLGVGKRPLGTPSHRRRTHSRARRQREPGNRLRRRAAKGFPAARRDDRCYSAGCMAPLSFFGGLYANGRDALSRRNDRTRCRRPSDGRAQAGMNERKLAEILRRHGWELLGPSPL